MATIHAPVFYGEPDLMGKIHVVETTLMLTAMFKGESPEFFINVGMMLVTAGMHGKHLVDPDVFLAEVTSCLKQSFTNLETHASTQHAEN